MKLFAKRALILTIFVLCLFGLTVLAASAAGTEYASDAAAVEAGAIARIGDEGGDGYYNSLKDALDASPATATIYLLQNGVMPKQYVLTDKHITLVGTASTNVVFTTGGGWAFSLRGTSSSLTVTNVDFSGFSGNVITFGASSGSGGEYAITMTGCNVSWESGSGAIYGYHSANLPITLKDCTFTTTKRDGDAIINCSTANCTNVTMSLDNVTLAGKAIAVYGTSKPVTVTVTYVAVDYASDAEAIADGTFFRVGATEGGEVYFKTLNEAVAAAASGDTIYVLANATVADIAFSGKSITLEGVGTVTVDGSASITAAFRLSDAAALTLKNISFTMGAKYLVHSLAGANVVTMENVTATTTSYVVHVNAAAALAEVTVTNGTFTAATFAWVAAGSLADLDITGATLKCSIYRTEATGGVLGSASDPATLTDVILDHNNGTPSGGFTFRQKTTAYIAVFGGRYNLRAVDYNTATPTKAGASFIVCRDGSAPTINVTINKDSTKSTEFHMGSYTTGTNQPYSNFLSINAYGVDITDFVYEAYNTSFKAYSNVSEMFTFRASQPTGGAMGTVSGTISFTNCSFDTPGRIFNLANTGNSITTSTHIAGTVNLTTPTAFDSDATALEFGMTVRLGDTEGGEVYYADLHSALNAAPVDNGNGGATMVYVIADSTMANVGRDGNMTEKFCKKVHITSVGTTPLEVDTTGTINFYLGSGAEIIFTNITFNLEDRLARIDGSCSIIFGNGCTMNSAGTYFIYDNGNTFISGSGTDDTTDDVYVSDLNYTIDIQKGAVIKATGALAYGLILRSSSVSAAAITLKVEGTIEMTAAKPILADTGKKASCTIYLDASKVTCPGTWLSLTYAASYDAIPVHIKGTAADAAKLAQMAHDGLGAYAMTYSADPSAEWNYYFFCHTQLLPKQFSVLNSYGGEVWQLRTVGSVYTTVKLTDLGTVTMKSYNGATITLQGEENTYRIQFTRTTVIMNGIELKAPGASVWLNPGSGATPTVLKMVNGAKITGTTSKSATLVKLSGSDTHLYVDSTSSLTQSGTTTSASAVVYADSSWKYSTIVIEGTIASTVTGNTECSLIKVDSTQTTYVVSVNINNLVDENGASTLGSVTPFLFPSGATPNLGLCTNDEAKIALIKAYTVSIGGVAQPAFDATKTVRGDFQHYYNTLAGGMLGVDNGGTVTVLKDIALSASSHYIEYKSFTIQGLTGSEELTMAGQMVDGVPVKVGKHMFNISNNAHVTFKHIYITADRFVVFRAAGEDSVLTVTLGEGAHVTNVDLATDNDILIYGSNELKDANGNVVYDSDDTAKRKAYGAGNIVINIEAGASLITKALSSVSPGYGSIAIHQAASVTLNVWGTLKNLAIVPDGKNAQVFVAKGKYNNATLNVYDGAVIEGTSDSESYSGNYSGIVYFSEGYSGGNAINMSGGTVTIHGNTGFAYVGIGCVINISGGTIDNRDGKYALFFGSSPVATISGTAEKKPTFYVNAKLLGSGTLNNAVNAFTEDTAATAGTLGFSLVYLETGNAYVDGSAFGTILGTVPDGGEGTFRIVAPVSWGTNVRLENKSITIIGMDDVIGDSTYDLTYSGSGYIFNIYNLASLTFKNVNFKTGRPLVHYYSSALADIAQEDKDITLSFINSYLNYSGSSRFIISDNHGDPAKNTQCDTFTVTVDETSTLSWVANSTDPIYMFYFNHSSHKYVVLDVAGTIYFKEHITDPDGTIFFMANNTSGATVTFTETAHLIVDVADPITADRIFYFATGTNTLSIHENALLDANGELTLSGMRLFRQYSNSAAPTLLITAESNANEAKLLGLICEDVNASALTCMKYRAIVDGMYYYTNVLNTAIDKVGGATQTAALHLYESGSSNKGIVLDGVTFTLSGEEGAVLTMSGSPAFKLDADSHLVIKNVHIDVTTAFVQIVNADTEKYTKLDLEAGAYVDLKAATGSGKYFLMIADVTNTGILTVNVKQGAKINATADATGGTQGLFQISTSRKNAAVAAGSSINVNGEIDFSQNYTGEGYAPIFMVNNPNLTININDGATVTMGHTGTTKTSVWHAIFCFDGKATVNVGNATLRANANGSLFGINGGNVGAVLTVTGATFTAESFPIGVVDGYTSNDTSYNTQKVTFNNCTFTGNVASHSRMTGIVLNNATFKSQAHAADNFGVLRVGNSATTGYYSQTVLEQAAAAANGGTLYVVTDFTTARAYEMRDVNLTIASPEGERYTITSHLGGGNGTFLLTFRGSCNVTLQNIDINGKGRTIAFRESTTATAPSSLRLVNADVYGVASGSNANAMIDVSGSEDAKYRDTQYFSLYIDAQSSVGYRDGDPASIRSTRNYQVIFYYAPVTGNILIEGEVYAYVYFTGNQVDYEKVQDSWTSYGPNAQKMISIGNDDNQFFTGDIVITGKLTHKVVFPDKDQNGADVYPEDHPSLHSAYAFYAFGANAGVFLADSATITTTYINAYADRTGDIGFAESGDAYTTTCGTITGKYHYYGVGALLAFLNNNAYKNNRIEIANANGSNYGIVYDNTTYIVTDSDTGNVTAGGFDYYGATEIAAKLSELTGATINATTDATTSTKEIIVGIANRDVVQQYLPEIQVNEYAIVITADKILVLAWHDAALEKAYASFKYALQANAEGNVIYMPNVTGVFTFVANSNWVDDFTKPADGTLWGAQYVDSNSLQYVYSGYANAQAGQAALNAYCDVLVAEGYTLVWQNVIENNMFRMYQNTTTGLALYVAYNDYAYKDEYYGTNGNDGLYGQEESDKTNLPTINLSDDYFENRDHRKVLRVVSMPLDSVTMPDEGINVPDFTYNKVTNTLQTTLSFQESSVGLGHVYMLEDGRFLVIDGGGTGNTNEGDKKEHEAIYEVIKKMYTNVYGHEPTEEQPLHIAAWYLTHTHWDHVSAFTHFAKNYGADIVLDYVIANVPVQQSVYKNAEVQYSASQIATLISYFKGGNAKYLKVCTGQKLYLANLEIEVLMTFMDHAPFDIVNTNDTNTVTRFKIHNQDALNGVTAEMLYLGDSWRHSSRILCEMYGDYLQTEIVQLAHHGNIGCERILYKTVAPRAVFFSHNAPSFKSYVYFNNIIGNNAAVSAAFRYAADVWCATNAEYMWSAPYGTYNMLEFKPSRPDYENIKDLFTGVKLTEGDQYDTNYKRTNSTKKAYIHNVSKGYKDVNVVWGDLSFTYEAGSVGTWNAATHEYEGAVAGKWVANGDNRIFVGNASTGNSQTVNVELKFTAATDCSNFTGVFSDNGAATLGSMGTKIFTFNLNTTSLPTTDIKDKLVGNITVSLK